MKNFKWVILLSCFPLFVFAKTNLPGKLRIYETGRSDHLTSLAIKELQRYIYVLTGELAGAECVDSIKNQINPTIILSRTEWKGQTPHLGKYWTANHTGFAASILLAPDEFQLISLNSQTVKIRGGSSLSLLHGIYRFLESKGCLFSLSGEIIPRIGSLDLSGYNAIFRPDFTIRGILPFHDFPEGPDWWTADDYKCVISQLPKLGMNFIGFHSYPFEQNYSKKSKAEPLVWIGSPASISKSGQAEQAYPVTYANTGDSTWNYLGMKTSSFHLGAAQLFDTETYGNDLTRNLSPWPHSENENLSLLNRMGSLLDTVFSLARSLGVKTCIGTETPLRIPETVLNQMTQRNAGFSDDSCRLLAYKGVFSKIMKTHPLDYFWMWTPENWTWHHESVKDVIATQVDLQLAVKAAASLNIPFKLATCGWVLGPSSDRAGFDRLLPKEMPFSQINRDLGFAPVEPAFVSVSGRPKWEITWLEDDAAITCQQFWAGRVTSDAAHALNYGCSGLIGLHWRTDNLSPQIFALERAGWNASTSLKNPLTHSRDYPVQKLYLEWCAKQFGPGAAPAFSKIFLKLDGGGKQEAPGVLPQFANFPRSSSWGVDGPGLIKSDPRPWKVVRHRYDFIADFENAGKGLVFPQHRIQFDYWLNTFQYARAQGHIACLIGELKGLEQTGDDREKIRLATISIQRTRRLLLEEWSRMTTLLLERINSKGELGTLANLEEHNLGFGKFLTFSDSLYLKLTGKMPQSAGLGMAYRGKERIVQTTHLGLVAPQIPLKLQFSILSNRSAHHVVLHWREIGAHSYHSKTVKNRLRNTFYAQLSQAERGTGTFEYYLTAGTGDAVLRCPAAGQRSQTVVQWE